MRRRYQRRTAVRYSTSGHSLFGGTGWLFADLLLALALAFLLATTVGSAPPKTPPKTSPTALPTHKQGGGSPQQPPPLELDPAHITFTIADPAGLAAGSSSAVAAVRATILQKTRGIKSRSAGIVLLFGDDSSDPTYEQVDQGVENILKSLSGTGPLFHQETRYVSFLNLRGPTQFAMDVYLFSTTS
jgi:hypothetical protein